jgi:hypothetical protein
MDWESFYDAHPSPSNYEPTITAVENFVCSHENKKIVLVTVSIFMNTFLTYQIFLRQNIFNVLNTYVNITI